MPAMILQVAMDGSPSDAAMGISPHVPLGLDIALHVVPATALLLDFFFFEHKYGPRTTKTLAPLLALAYAVGYGAWVEHCGAMNSGTCTCLSSRDEAVPWPLLNWLLLVPYPFLTNNPLNIRLWIYGGAGLIAPLFFWMLNSLHS